MKKKMLHSANKMIHFQRINFSSFPSFPLSLGSQSAVCSYCSNRPLLHPFTRSPHLHPTSSPVLCFTHNLCRDTQNNIDSTQQHVYADMPFSRTARVRTRCTDYI